MSQVSGGEGRANGEKIYTTTAHVRLAVGSVYKPTENQAALA